ncbi:abortive infection family protein [Stutzerimonas nitrititolerans]|uniref:abortive infection family protein n=1 Tax=Stutzerimonas nitrititolerans TaxID=2482751 RepID=UPI0009EA63FC|nr:abortive infection family protein [Stutzerimonas nitrititolerans]
MTTRKEALKQLVKQVRESRSEVRVGLETIEKDLREAVDGLSLYVTGIDVGLGYVAEDDWKYGILSFDGENLRVLTSTTMEDGYNYGTPGEGMMTSRHISEFKDDEELTKMASPESINSIWVALEEKIRELLGEAKSAARLLSEFSGAQSESIHEQLSSLITEDYFDKQWAKARLTIDTDASDSLTRSNSFLESVCRHYLEQRNIPLPGTKTTVELIAAVVADFPRPGVEEDAEAQKDVLKLFGGIKSIGAGVGSFRTHLGTAHGGDKRVSPNEARLINNLAGAAAIYILEKLKVHMAST